MRYIIYETHRWECNVRLYFGHRKMERFTIVAAQMDLSDVEEELAKY